VERSELQAKAAERSLAYQKDLNAQAEKVIEAGPQRLTTGRTWTLEGLWALDQKLNLLLQAHFEREIAAEEST